MSSRFAAARPKRASEAYARAHHGESRASDSDSGPSNKKVKFDVRNPSALAPSAHDDDLDEADDEILAADVIGGLSRATKRGAVNIDGYDSDSDNDNLEDRAEARGKGRKKGKDAEDVDLAEVMDNYNKPSNGAQGGNDDDDEVDMFNDLEDDDGAEPTTAGGTKKGKSVHFLADTEIEGQDLSSKAGGKVTIDPAHQPKESDEDDDDDGDDEETIAAAIAEEGIDEEVGLGGLKKHAPKIDAFNMRAEQEEGAFDEAGNFIRRAADANAVHDKWLEGLSKKEIKKAAAAHEKREAERRQQEREDDKIATGDLLRNLILTLEKGETALEALARLGKDKTKGPKKVPKWKMKKQERKQGIDSMDIDEKKQEEAEDPKQKKIREAIDAITEAADKLLGRDYPDIYDKEREWLVREYRAETGETWMEPTKPKEEEEREEKPLNGNGQPRMWEFRWTDGRDGGGEGGGGSQGPYDGPTMKAWQDAGYFKEAVEFRPVGGGEGDWSRVATFV
ncbi:hypothetical protein SMACR_04188 [Sordaria macrospora]|uniref:WGS project CABT00000000 data, contig 2.15 n=2 Tax=Sordaria macrospora TaxID=5147 RepID=F7VZL1_SORMK|nr:uncharacterized protein SMAC_04188 [Sordaria macrospora k-hell]KAA8629613.1 hypothetical protein SMACR_04188 [Sordaria macrospora]KAH7636029.1 hypothetical protein B0T09DRAFT_31915 [Sordaria sp. MPI-SDFR-AT-0083]WPJ64489.1 hypothetical protein SMAC4_04188 [Sordaria macrospora]CCC10959.1 unnamed protein product [Sordaria macrospora k-hell]